MAKGGLAKQRFRDRQRHNRIVAQLETLKAGGVTEEQVRAAGTSAWREYGGQALANLEAQKAGQTPTAITAPGTTTTPAGATATTFSQGPAWANASYSPAQMDTAAPPNTQWWQRVNQSRPAATTSSNPFANVSGSAGTTIANPYAQREAATSAALTANANAAKQNQASPYVPKWLGNWWQTVTQPINSFDPALRQGRPRDPVMSTNQYGGTGNTPYGPVLAPGTVSRRNVDPSTGIPDFPMLAGLGEGPGGGGYGYNWKKRRKGGGGGGRWYQPRPDYAYDNKGREPFVPSSGLASWSIG
jgi:hypothetical protein